MVISLLASIKERWLTWTTGKDKKQRDWEKWRDETIVHCAHDVQNYYVNFKHVFEVDPDKFWNHSEPFGWVPVEEFNQYQYPIKPLGDNAVFNWFRGYWDQWSDRFIIEEMCGGDHVFVATNNDEDALMIALKYK